MKTLIAPVTFVALLIGPSALHAQDQIIDEFGGDEDETSDDNEALSDEEALEVLRNHKGRVELTKLLEEYESGEIDEAEYQRRAAEIREKYLAEKPPQPDPCEGVTCGGVGTCEVKKGNPTCVCPELGYVDNGDSLDCVPAPKNPGWSRGAAIAGLIATPTVSILGYSAFGAHNAERPRLSTAFMASGVSILALMGPTVAAGANSARGSALVEGTPILRIPAHLFYVAGSIGSLVNVLLYNSTGDVEGWPVLLWSGVGAMGLALHSIDAAVSYSQSISGAHAESGRRIKRPWTWAALLSGVAAGTGALVLGTKARDEFDRIADLEAGEMVCEDMVGSAGSCATSDLENNARRMAGGADVLIGVAGTGLVMGAVLFFVEPKLPCPKVLTDVTLTPFGTPDGGGLMLGGRF